MERVLLGLTSLLLVCSLTQAEDVDPGPQHSLVITSTAGGHVTVPGEGAFVYGDGQFVRLEAQAQGGFVFVGWSGTYNTTQNPTYLPLHQDHNVRADFVSTRDVIYVDGTAPADPAPGDAAVSDPWEDGTSKHPFDAIQEAVDVAAEGASVIVRPGIYYENIDLVGKNIQVFGFDPQVPSTAAYPVIDGGGTGPVVTFAGGEDPNCLLAGFVITGGVDWQGGAIVCSGSSPTLMNCLVVGNRGAGLNAAAVCCIESNALFVNCTIADNHSSGVGGGLCLLNSNVAIVDSILWGNMLEEILLDGTSELSVRYSNIAGGWPGMGNLNDDPVFAQRGYWADPNDLSVAAQPGDAGAIWVDGDYHLASQAGRWDPQKQAWVTDTTTSVCIDTGDPAIAVGDEPASDGNVINMGAYGGTAQASKFYLEDIKWHRPVAFGDAHLKELVEAALWVWDPTPADMLGLTAFSARLEGICDLTGLQYATNMQSLDLAVNEIADISPLSQLTSMRNLVLNNNRIRSLSPIVRLTQLEHLDIHENQVADLSPLSRLERLKRVIVYQNEITDISVVSGLSHLLSLDLLDNQITDIAPLTALTSLRTLDLRSNPLEPEAYDLYIPQIEANNPGIEIKHDPLVPCRLTILSSGGGSVIQPGEGIFTYEQGETVCLEARANPGYVFSGWSGTYSSTSNPAYLTMNQNNSIWANFVESNSGP